MVAGLNSSEREVVTAIVLGRSGDRYQGLPGVLHASDGAGQYELICEAKLASDWRLVGRNG